MRRVILVPLAVIAILVLLLPAAQAASPHFKGRARPTCTFSTSPGGIAVDTVTCSGGALAGLGNADVEFDLTGTGFATFLCTNKGGNAAAGQNKVPFQLESDPVVISTGDIKNGTLVIPTLTRTTPTPTATAEEAGCPNPNWTAEPATVAFTSVSLTIEQPPGTPIFNCTASDPDGFAEGETVTLTCTPA